MKENISKILFIVLFAASFFMPTALSLIAGILIAVTLGAPFKKFSKKTSKYLLQLSVIGLGFGMNLYSAVETGKDGMLFTIISVIGVMCLGVALGKAFRLSRNNSYLISSGTAICGGSAIAAMAPIIDAEDSETTLSMATVFTLNAVALIVFPAIGHWIGLSQEQFGMWAAIAINFLDRTTLAIATPHIMEEIHITTEEMGMLMSAFFLCYALLQIPAGFISDKFGQRKILGLSVFWWSIATGLTGLASGFKSFLLCRMVLGIGEAGAYPSNAAITRKWFPKSERATVGGLFDSGQKFGGAFGIPILTWLMVSVGWRETFAILGALGVIWAIVWYTFFRDNPSEHKGVNKAELDIIHDGQEAETDKTMPLKWYQLLKYRNVIAMSVGFFMINYNS